MSLLRSHGIDISKYDKGFNPANTSKQLDFVLQRVSYRKTRDELFDILWQGVSKVLIRLGYHYLNSDTPWKEQADAFLGYITGYPFHAYACDFEAAYNVLSTKFAYEAWQWIVYVAQKTGKPVLLYTSPSLYDAYITPSQSVYGIDWNKVDYWQAQWFYVPNPNGTPTMPKGRTAGWKLWQYTGRGSGYGTVRDYPTDLNVYNGAVEQMKSWLNISSTVPDQPVITVPREGVTQTNGILNGEKYYLLTVDLTGKSARVESYSGRLVPVPTAAQADKPAICVNGDDYGELTYFQPRGMSYTDGIMKTPAFEYRYWLNISRTNVVSYGYGNVPSDAYNLTSFIRPLVVNGSLHPSLFEDKIENKEIHARSYLGVDAKGRLLICVCEGFVNPLSGFAYAGSTLPQGAQLMKDNGAVFAGEHGGGGDAGVYLIDRMLNESSDRDAGQGWRGVVQTIKIFDKENDMAYGKATETLGKEPTVRSAPAVLTNNDVRKLLPGAEIYFVKIVPGSVVPADQWFKLPDGNFVNYVLGGRSYFRVDSMPTEEPVDTPVASDMAVDISMDGDNVTVTASTANKYGTATFTMMPK